ncbi:MAG: Fibronectin, type domain protein [Cyanobacteria bacterium RYN_339]|nr:Fibronectin, type domain protein [Cyanobacteria bacterium RYN_339]
MPDEQHDQIGQFLLNAGSITPAALAEALAFKADKPFMRVGEILLGQGACTLPELVAGLEAQGASLRLGQILVRNGHVSQTQLDAALERQARTSELLGAILVEQGLISETCVLEALEYQHWFQEYVARGATVLRNNPSLASVHNPVIHPRWAAAPGVEHP